MSDPNPIDCTPKPTTRCDRDRKNNVWIEGGNRDTGVGGVCLLDTTDEATVIWILERDEVARKDLVRVTSDPRLLELARTVPRLPTYNEGDDMQHRANANPAGIPFYSAFRGQPPFSQ